MSESLRSLSRLILMTLAINLIVMSGVDAQRYGRDRGRNFNYHRNVQLVNDALRYADRMSFRVSVYKLRTVLLDLENMPRDYDRRELTLLIEDTMDELDDFWTPSYQKQRSMRRAAPAIIRSIRAVESGDYRRGGRDGPLPSRSRISDRFFDQVDEMKRAANNYWFYEVEDLAEEMLDELERIRRPNEDIGEAIGALETIIDKVDDPFLSFKEKKEVVHDCLDVLMESLSLAGFEHPRLVLTYRDLQAAIDAMDDALRAVSNRSYNRAVRILRAIERRLEQFQRDQDRHLDEAISAVETIIEKIQDPHLSNREKRDIAHDCAEVFDENIQESYAYIDDRPVNYSGARVRELGITKLFSKSRQEERTLRLSRTQGPFRALKIQARDDSLSLVSVEVTFGNNDVQYIPLSQVVYENRHIFVDLRGNKRNVKSIRVRAQSAVFWGTKARARIYGVL